MSASTSAPTGAGELPDPSEWFGQRIEPGQRATVAATVSKSFAGADVRIPVSVWRAERPGPTLAIIGAVHGDELNGTGVIRHLTREQPFELTAGTLVMVPVVNIFGFERHSRYLPDRRDLNRSFPGSPSGSLTARLAHDFFSRVIRRCDYCIDLHTAALRRTNFPNVRADMRDPRVAGLARAFGAELLVWGEGPEGSLRREACRAGCPTIILEAGEVWKVESAVVEYAVRGITNCVRWLGMSPGEPEEPPYRVEARRTRWIRAAHGGFLEFHVAPGDIVEKDDAVATNTDLVGNELNVIRAPAGGIILGATTIPSVSPGDPICHLALFDDQQLDDAADAVERLDDDSLHERIRSQLAGSMAVTESDPDPEDDPDLERDDLEEEALG